MVNLATVRFWDIAVFMTVLSVFRMQELNTCSLLVCHAHDILFLLCLSGVFNIGKTVDRMSFVYASRQFHPQHTALRFLPHNNVH